MDDAQPLDFDLELASARLAKTDRGREEIRTRVLRLPPMVRQVLVLADGQRDVHALSEMMPGQNVTGAVRQLLQLGCVELLAQPASAPSQPRPAPVAAPAPAAASPLVGLPPPESRTPKQVEMARHFMINTINTLLEQNSRLTLVKQIFDSAGAAELRQHEPDWEAALGSSWMGKKRLPELRKKLFEVL
jgi:hypothetical protein